MGWLGQLDRVVHGMPAEEILNACDESVSNVPSASSEGGLANPAVHFFRKTWNFSHNIIRNFVFF